MGCFSQRGHDDREIDATANTTSLRDHSRRQAQSADPLGPDSLTWKYFGDLRTGMLGVALDVPLNDLVY